MAYPDMRPISFTYAPMASMWVVTLHSLILYLDAPLPCHIPSCCLRLFLSQTFSHIHTPTFLKPSHFYTYLPMRMEQTQCSKTLAYKIQKKAYNIQNMAKVWNQEYSFHKLYMYLLGILSEDRWLDPLAPNIQYICHALWRSKRTSQAAFNGLPIAALV
jgi:hypothetical protein